MAKIIRKNKNLVFLGLIVLFGAFLRFWRLTEVPISLFGDEVDVGYQAWSILKTGKDYSGNFLPIHFQSLADWRTPLFLYATVPFVWLFGLTELGVRFLPALMGVLSIPAMYLLVKELFLSLHLTNYFTSQETPLSGATLRGVFPQEFLPLIAAFLLAISPWHLQYSRAAFEVTQMLFLIILGTWAFLRSSKNGKWLTLSAVCLALTPYSYNTAKLFTPLFIGLLVLSFWEKVKKINKKQAGIAIFIFVLISLPMIYDIFLGEGGNRFSTISIFADPTIIPQIGFERLVDAGMKLGNVTAYYQPSSASRFFHNKFLSWGMAFLTNYFHVFSTDFLFTRGDMNLRHSVQGGFGQFYWLEAIFLLMGVYWLLVKIKSRKLKLFLIGWLFLSPLPSVLTRDGGYHATRLILILPPLLIFISLGILGFLGDFGKEVKKRKKMVGLPIIAGYLLCMTLYLHHYYVHWSSTSEEWWHYGYKQLATYVKENENKYDYIVWSDRDQPPLIFSFFWLGVDPHIIQNIVQKDKLDWEQISDAIWADHLLGTKYYFGHISEERLKANGLIGTLKPNILYLAPEVEIGKDFRYEPVPESVKLLDTIYYPSGRIVKYILTGL